MGGAISRTVKPGQPMGLAPRGRVAAVMPLALPPAAKPGGVIMSLIGFDHCVICISIISIGIVVKFLDFRLNYKGLFPAGTFYKTGSVSINLLIYLIILKYVRFSCYFFWRIKRRFA
jgi:hypothetical protein